MHTFFTFTESQALAIAEKINSRLKEPYANTKNLYAWFGDNADEEMTDNGYYGLELSQYNTKSGHTETINIYEDEVTIEHADDE